MILKAKSLKKFVLFLGLFLVVFSHPFSLKANKSAEVKEASADPNAPFDPTDVIFHHILDAHDWHLWGEGHDAVSIPLPVIVWTPKGLDIFSSSHVHEGHVYDSGKYTYRLNEEVVEATDEAGASVAVMDFSITKNVASMFISVAILLLIFFSMAGAYKKTGITTAPKGLQSFFEPLVVFVRDDIAKTNIGSKSERFVPFLLTVFFFILINNVLGMLPIGANLTGNIAVTLVLSVITLIVTNVNGNGHYWHHIFMPPVPAWLLPIMIPVEIVGILSKPFALMIRLFANITAGHIIIISLISLIFIFKAIAIAAVSVPFALFIDVLECLVAFLQAYIFTMLTALFIGSAVHDPHEHDHAKEHAEAH